MGTSLLRMALAFLVLVGSSLARPAAADPPLVFPGCAPTLQGCIDAAPDGAVIQVATDGPIDEDLLIGRSLELVAAPGFRPVFAQFADVRVRAAGGGDRRVVLGGLVWDPTGFNTVIDVLHDGAGAFDVELRDNEVHGGGVTSTIQFPLVKFRTGGTAPGGPLRATLRGNRFDVPAGTRTHPVDFGFTAPLDGTVRIEENTVRTADTAQRGAIFLLHHGGDLTFEVVRNVIETANPGQAGVEVRQDGDDGGRTVARVIGNLITAFDGGMRFGVELYAAHGTMDVTVAHNTVVGASLRAVQVGGREDLGSLAAGVIANNVLAGSGDGDVGIHEFETSVFEVNNLLTDVDEDDSPFSPGPGSIVADPLFVAADDFRLQPVSPGVNAADPTHLPADVTLDLDGLARIAGPAPDLGAYELPCAPGETAPHCLPTTTTTLPPTCTPATCASDDPCAPAACVQDECVAIPPVGLESARCACDRAFPDTCAGVDVPVKIGRRTGKACLLLGRVSGAKSPRQASRRLIAAARSWDRAARQATSRRFAAVLPGACAEDLAASYEDGRDRTRALLD